MCTKSAFAHFIALYLLKNVIANCYMTPIKDLLWLAETSLHWLWQIMISNSDEQVNISFVSADRELKID